MKLFIAIDFNESTVNALASAGDYLCGRFRMAPHALEERDDLHLTLRYLGGCVALEQAAARLARISIPAFSLKLHGAGAFQNSGETVLWAGVDGELTRLRELKSAIDAALSGLPLSPETLPFSPHITLTTLNEDTCACAGLIEECPVTASVFSVERFHLYGILAENARPRFQKLATFALERKKNHA